MIQDNTNLPLADLASRHVGLTEAVANAFIEAARVCLDRHHDSPRSFQLIDDSEECTTNVLWEVTDERTRRAWANDIDATEAGAYAMAIASAELSRKFITVSRAETKTGADYYVAPVDADAEDMENWIRLEVSGTDLNTAQVGYRVTQKVAQAKKGQSNLPALAAVVGFKASLISLRSVETE